MFYKKGWERRDSQKSDLLQYFTNRDVDIHLTMHRFCSVFMSFDITFQNSITFNDAPLTLFTRLSNL